MRPTHTSSSTEFAYQESKDLGLAGSIPHSTKVTNENIDDQNITPPPKLVWSEYTASWNRCTPAPSKVFAARSLKVEFCLSDQLVVESLCMKDTAHDSKCGVNQAKRPTDDDMLLLNPHASSAKRTRRATRTKRANPVQDYDHQALSVLLDSSNSSISVQSDAGTDEIPNRTLTPLDLGSPSCESFIATSSTESGSSTESRSSISSHKSGKSKSKSSTPDGNGDVVIGLLPNDPAMSRNYARALGECWFHGMKPMKNYDCLDCTECQLQFKVCNFPNCLCKGKQNMVLTNRKGVYFHVIPSTPCIYVVVREDHKPTSKARVKDAWMKYRCDC